MRPRGILQRCDAIVVRDVQVICEGEQIGHVYVELPVSVEVVGGSPGEAPSADSPGDATQYHLRVTAAANVETETWQWDGRGDRPAGAILFRAGQVVETTEAERDECIERVMRGEL